MNKKKVLWGLTGSVASKLKEKIALYDSIFEIQFIATHSTFPFLKDTNVLSDADEWADISTVLHIDLIKWADYFVIAPCSANTLAKLANGICDNLLTCCARAWDFQKTIVVAPSMNTNMWNHPATQPHIKTLESWGYKIISPQSKKLYCGDYGIGAMANIEDIFAKIIF